MFQALEHKFPRGGNNFSPRGKLKFVVKKKNFSFVLRLFFVTLHPIEETTTKLTMTNSIKSLFIAFFSAVSLSAGADVVWYDGSNAVSYEVEGKAAPVVQQALRLF